MNIPIEQILPSPEPVRKQMEPAKLDELAQSIREQGLIVPIKVRPNKAMEKYLGKDAKENYEYYVDRESSGDIISYEDYVSASLFNIDIFEGDYDDAKFEIVYGHRRFAACKMAGREEIECIVEGVDDDDSLVQALIENVQREDMNDADVRDALREIKQRTGKTWVEIGAMFGWSESKAQSIGGMSDTETEIIRKSSMEDFGERHVRMAKMAKDKSDDVLRKAAKEGLTSPQVEAVAKSVANTLDPKRKQHLIDTPYSPYTHDPEWNKERAEKYGASDPTSFENGKTKTQTWQELPETKAVFNYLKESAVYADKVTTMFAEGKFAPEAKQFTIAKIKSMLGAWENTIKELEK